VNDLLFVNATLILPDRLVPQAVLWVNGGRIGPFGTGIKPQVLPNEAINLNGQYIAPGFIDLHVHGGDGADFMDGTAEAFRTVCRCHTRHGTTALTPTSTVARAEHYQRFLERCREFTGADTGGARVLGGHFYGPYFARAAKGCHPDADFLTPETRQDEKLLDYAGRGLTTLTVAPELPGAERLVRAARERGLLVTAGHSHATFPQMEAAVGWGVRHVDHLFCAMSDRARLRQSQTYPMRAGVMEATLYFDELTTEVIADGKHLSADLLKLAYKLKGPDRLALVTDAMRAVDCPDREYWFGPAEGGEKVRKVDGVGVTLDGTALASGVMGLDHCVRTFYQLTGAGLPEVVRMASLTPARILGIDHDYGSLEAGKRADLVVLDRDLQVEQVYIEGRRVV
jgi:N-acetylglucosamine-6-phosphate deacetylase